MVTLCWAVEMRDTNNERGSWLLGDKGRGLWLLGRFGASKAIPAGLSGYRLATWDNRRSAREFCASKRAEAKGSPRMTKYWRGAKPVRVRVTVEAVATVK